MRTVFRSLAVLLLSASFACEQGKGRLDARSADSERHSSHSHATLVPSPAEEVDSPLPPPSPPSPQAAPNAQVDLHTSQPVGQASVPDQATLAPLVETVQPTVVGVTSRRGVDGEVPEEWRRFFGDQLPAPPEWHEEAVGTGSGVIISADGYILTNHHVVAGAEEIRVRTVDEEEYEAELVGSDPETDLALLRLLNLEEPLVPARLGNSESLRVGDFVVAIGHPFGLALTVTSGIISAKSRVIGLGPYDEFLQTDAAINPGNSGGPLFDLEGNVVGITTAILARGQGIGFAIPIDLAQALLPQLREAGRVVRAFIGVSAQDVTTELAAALDLEAEAGALIAAVPNGTPAQRAGLRPGDVVVGIDETPVEDARDLSHTIASRQPGERLTLHYLRDGERRSAEVTLAERPSMGGLGTPGQEEREGDSQDGDDSTDSSASSDSPNEHQLGVRVQVLPPHATANLGVQGGVLIVGVEPGSRAHRAGLMPGDIVVEANRHPVTNSDELAQAVKESDEADDALLIRVFREGQGIYVAVEE